jgi:hypothetical protein
VSNSTGTERVAEGDEWRELVENVRDFGVEINLHTIERLVRYVKHSDKDMSEMNYRRVATVVDPEREITEVSDSHWSQNPLQL